MDAAAPVNFVRELELRYRPGRWMRPGPVGPFNGPAAVYEALGAISRLPREVFIVIHLDSQNRPLGYDVASVGCSNATMVIPKDVVRPLLYSGADGCIVVHNHPSGRSIPSAADIETTRRLREVLDLCGLCFRDHIVIGDGEFTSLASEGLV
jgi:DNA repair protein RadC